MDAPKIAIEDDARPCDEAGFDDVEVLDASAAVAAGAPGVVVEIVADFALVLDPGAGASSPCAALQPPATPLPPETPARAGQPQQAGGLPLTDAADAADRYAACARAVNTRRAYATDWRTFETWCHARALVALPCAPQTLALYLADRASQGRKPATLLRAATAIVRGHLMAGHKPSRTDPVRQVLQGIQRRHGMAPVQKAPLELARLRTVVQSLGERPIDVRDRALLLLGFAGAFRRQELVSVDVEHLQEGDEGLRVHLLRSKTDQTGLGRVVGIPYGSHMPTCPVRAWRALGLVPAGALFVGINCGGNSTGKRLTGRDVARLIKRRAAAVGLDPQALSGHSLRAGLVTTAIRAGKSERTIQEQTGHRSSAMLRRYVREIGVFEDNAAVSIGL